MANLKSELDDYLLQNENRRSYKFGLPTLSMPNFLTRKGEDSPTSSTSWYENVQKEYFTMSRTQRFMAFGICLILGMICVFLAFLNIPLLLLHPMKFTLLFTLGSICFIFSFAFIYGPWAFTKSLFTRERALNTILYGATLVGTLYCAMHLRNQLLTVIFAVLQVITLVWMMMGTVPGGASGMRFFGNMFKSSVSNTLPI